MKKQFLAVILTLSMLFSIFPVSALATADSTPVGGGDDITVIGQEQGEAVEEPTAEEKLAELIADLPDPEDIDPEDKAQVAEIYSQIEKIRAFAEENGLDVEGNEAINAVIAAAWPPETTDTVASITSDGGDLASGTYTLSGNITLTTANLTIPKDNTVTIDLAGYTLTGTGNGSVITVNGTLTIMDSQSGGTITGGGAEITDWTTSANQFNGGAVYIGKGGTVTLESGKLTNNKAYNGGGVYVYSDGEFIMNGGEISNNTSVRQDNGGAGGVYVLSNSQGDENGKFTMTGGTITGNTSARQGGGVFVAGEMTMTGGTISKNTAPYGGGVCVNGTLTMTGGSITENTATIPEGLDSTAAEIQGGGVKVNGGTFNFYGGLITNNTATSTAGAEDTTGITAYGGGVYSTAAGTINVSGAPKVSDNETDDEDQNIYLMGSSVLTLVGNLTSEAKLPVTRETVTGRVTESGSYTIPDGVISMDSSDGEVSMVTLDGEIYFTKTVNEADAVCSVTIGGTSLYYETLAEAIAALPSGGGEVTILQEINLDSTISIAPGTSVTLTAESGDDDDTGKTITWEEADSDYFSVPAGAELTVKGNIEIKGSYDSTDEDALGNTNVHAFNVNGGTLNLGEKDSSSAWPKVTGFNTYKDSSGYGTVYIRAGGTLNLYSGTLSGNKANHGGAIYGIGTGTTLNLYGGTVTENTAAGHGGGVYSYSSINALNIIGTTISGNTAASNGGGVYNQGSTVTVSGGTISGNNASNGGGIYSNNGTLSIEGGTIGGTENGNGNTASSNGGGLYVNNGNVTISGGTISGNSANGTNGGGMFVNSASLTMSDGTISNNTATNGAGVYVNTNGTAKINGGTIDSNTATSNGGGMYTRGTVTFTNGTISSNSASATGGGVFVNANSLTMNGGTISDNTATNNGGGVYANNSSVVNISGGTISKNSASNLGGGMYVTSGASANVSGGTITGNSATSNGGGIYLASGTGTGKLTVSDNPTIIGNTNGTGDSAAANNVYLQKNTYYITLGGALTGTIGVTTETEPTNGSPVKITTQEEGSTKYYETSYSHFIYDAALAATEGSHIAASVNGSGYVEFAYSETTKYTVTFDLPEGVTTGSGATVEQAVSGSEYTFTLELDEAYNKSKPVVKMGDEELTANDAGEYTVTVTGNTEIMVTDVKINTYTITFTADGETVTTETVSHGGTLAVSSFPAVPDKSGYTGAWDVTSDITNVTADQTVTAEYTANPVTPSPSTPSGSSGSSTTYPVTVDSAKNGTVSVSPKNASKGTTVTITAKPADGYEVDEVIVTDKNGDTVKVTAKGNDKYTFVMPAGKVDVEVTFVKEYVAPSVSFTDVKSNAWYYDAALYAAENGLMSGTGNGAFSPDLTTSRAMIWTILARVDGQNISVTYGNWYDKAQAWAMAAGVSDGTNPDSAITREQLAVMLYGFAKEQGYTTTGGVSLSRYVDASDVSAWAVEALEWAVGNGLISSMGNNILAPTGTATRAQVAVILMNFCENIAK